MLSEGNQIHNFISSSGSGNVINYGSGSDFLTSSGSTRQKVTVPTVPVPQHCPPALSFFLNWSFFPFNLACSWKCYLFKDKIRIHFSAMFHSLNCKLRKHKHYRLKEYNSITTFCIDIMCCIDITSIENFCFHCHFRNVVC
jgi:hypothetical protein